MCIGCLPCVQRAVSLGQLFCMLFLNFWLLTVLSIAINKMCQHNRWSGKWWGHYLQLFKAMFLEHKTDGKARCFSSPKSRYYCTVKLAGNHPKNWPLWSFTHPIELFLFFQGWPLTDLMEDLLEIEQLCVLCSKVSIFVRDNRVRPNKGLFLLEAEVSRLKERCTIF